MQTPRQKWLLLVIGALIGLICLYIFQRYYSFHQFDQREISNQHRAYTPFSIKPTSITFYPTSPTLETIFSEKHDWIASLSAARIRTMIATGDVSLARQVNIQILQKDSPSWPFEKTKNILESADIAFINLENPLIENCPIINTGFTFCGEETNIGGLVFAGIDVVNFANNHASNYGIDGVDKTVQLLEQNNILVSGVHGPTYKTVDGLTFAFLGYNEVNIQPGVNTAEEALIKNEIAEARANADIVVVQFHWGVEYTYAPNSRQKLLGRLAIDSGADVVVGNHPHWYQAVELYNGGFVAYSHGNFVFDQMWSQQTREGIIGKYTFYDTELIDVEFIPIFIYDYGQPAVIDDPHHRQEIINTLKTESLKVASQSKSTVQALE